MTNIDRIYQKYKKQSDREISIEKLRLDLGEMIDNIVLYGAGSAGIAFLHYLQDADIHPRFFSDGDEKRWNTSCEGLKVLSPKKIVDEAGENALVITTINTDGKNYCKSFDEALRKGGPVAVHKKLQQAGCKNIIDYSFFRRCYSLFRNEKYNLPSCSDVYLMDDKKTILNQIAGWLEDDISKDTFEKIIAFRMIDDSISIPTFEQKDEYFAYDVYRKIENEVFVDGGAYTGTTLDIFLENVKNSFARYYAVEPDRESFTKLTTHVNNMNKDVREKVISCNAALYDTTGDELPFVDLHSPGSFVNEIGGSRVVSSTIDDIVGDDEVTFIKMNIEGCEIPALHGGEKTIRKNKPVLAIMGYHKTWDLWEVPLLIKEYYEGYHFFLRSHMNHMSFMFYAIPEWRLLHR